MTAKKAEFVPVKHHLRWRGWFASASLAILIASTCIWATLSARVQQTNADQLINPLLFENNHTFSNALFPSAHSFLLKWPLFWLVQHASGSTFILQATTVLVVLVTVVLFAYILFRIERRPVERGVLYLALASILTLVPSQPYPGGLLPVNMAMLTTRNIEYILFICAIFSFVRWPKYNRSGFWVGTALLGLLIASDRLFLTLAIGAAVIALAVFGVMRRRQLLRASMPVFIGSVAAAVASIFLIVAVNKSGLTHISAQGEGPFTLVGHVKDVALGFIFGLLGIASNFGANPVFDAATFSQMPHALQQHMLSLAGPAYLVNIMLAGIACWAMVRTVYLAIASPKQEQSVSVKACLFLIFSALAAFMAFVGTSHYYYVDARYLAIVLFAGAISVATISRLYHFRASRLCIVAAVLLCSIVFGLFGALHNYHADLRAQQPFNARNALIAEALRHHPVDVVVGDYWRVLPLKNISPRTNVMPLDGCTQVRQILSSSAWQANLKQTSFAYVLSFDKSLTNYPSCSLQQVLRMYGQPDFNVLIAGRLDKPQEMLLFYTPHKKIKPVATPATVLPTTLDQYPVSACTSGSTVMNIVAHQDDDLLFLSPDLVSSIRDGACVRTVYITAGDAGSGRLYWLGREHGSEAAYNVMTKNTQPWVERTVKLADGQFISIANPENNPKYSLVFMHLPDGNVRGQGFRSSHDESLAQLYGGRIEALHTVDGQSSYNLEQLESALQQLIGKFQPTQIRTQAPHNESISAPDHSDHLTVGKIVTDVQQRFTDVGHIPINYYVGYPVRIMPNNVVDPQLASKSAAFFAYAQYDPATCQSMQLCTTAAYGAYLKHQLTVDEFEQQYQSLRASQ